MVERDSRTRLGETLPCRVLDVVLSGQAGGQNGVPQFHLSIRVVRQCKSYRTSLSAVPDVVLWYGRMDQQEDQEESNSESYRVDLSSYAPISSAKSPEALLGRERLRHCVSVKSCSVTGNMTRKD